MGLSLPSFKEFKEKPLTAILYILFFAVGYLYVDMKVASNNTAKENKISIQSCIDKADRLSTEVYFLTEQVRRRDSALADVQATLRVLKQVGKIQ